VQEVEIKNIAVKDIYQGRGIGKLLLNDATKRATEQGFSTLSIGTSNASIGQLFLYQHKGLKSATLNTISLSIITLNPSLKTGFNAST